MSIYLDPSFLVSLYSLDVNSAATGEALQSALSSDTFLVSTFAELEVVNALELRLFRKQVSVIENRLALDAFNEDLAQGRFRVCPLPELLFLRARQLSLQTTSRMGTRASDLLHVVCALELAADTFYSFDQQQKRLAELVKLRVNP